MGQFIKVIIFYLMVQWNILPVLESCVCGCVLLKAVLNWNDCILNFCAVLCIGFVPSADVKVSIRVNQPNWHPEDGDSKFPQNSEQTHYTAQCIKTKDPPHENPHNSNTQLPASFQKLLTFHDQHFQWDWVYTWRNFMGLPLKILFE